MVGHWLVRPKIRVRFSVRPLEMETTMIYYQQREKLSSGTEPAPFPGAFLYYDSPEWAKIIRIEENKIIGNIYDHPDGILKEPEDCITTVCNWDNKMGKLLSSELSECLPLCLQEPDTIWEKGTYFWHKGWNNWSKYQVIEDMPRNKMSSCAMRILTLDGPVKEVDQVISGPINNQGRTTCFKCNGKTIQSPGFTAMYDICPRCKL